MLVQLFFLYIVVKLYMWLGMHKEFIMWKVKKIIKHTRLLNFLMLTLLLSVGPRTMQTAVGVFGGDNHMDGVDVPPLMVENALNSGRSAISSLNCPPFIAVESCRERIGNHPCDKRRSISEYCSLFPAIDFSLIENNEDILWQADTREEPKEVKARGMMFINWLCTRKEKEIAIVTHSGFLLHTLSLFGNDCHPFIKIEIHKNMANCELRSMVLVDRSMLGLDTSLTNYPGKIPQGTDLPTATP